MMADSVIGLLKLSRRTVEAPTSYRYASTFGSIMKRSSASREMGFTRGNTTCDGMARSLETKKFFSPKRKATAVHGD